MLDFRIPAGIDYSGDRGEETKFHGVAVRNLTIRTGGTALVHGVDLDLAPGRSMTLIGETGCGKSLIANAVLGLLPSDMSVSGEIQYQGKNLLSLTRQERQGLWGRDLFLFPQEPGTALTPLKRSGSQVSEIFRRILNFSPKQAALSRDQGFGQVDLSPADRSKYPFQLSGGMGQRLLTAIALAEPAWCILADEPTKGLGTGMKEMILSLLKKLTDQGKALFTITHDLMVPARLGGDLAVMYKGQIMESGRAKDVLTSPAHPYTRALIAASPENGLNPIKPVHNRQLSHDGCTFARYCPYAAAGCFSAKPVLIEDVHARRRIRCHSRA